MCSLKNRKKISRTYIQKSPYLELCSIFTCKDLFCLFRYPNVIICFAALGISFTDVSKHALSNTVMVAILT